MPLTKEQILALAPDDASAKAGSQLATPSKWVEKHVNDKAIWGACQGSGKNPYQTYIDLSNIAFKCNCPSRKFPCKHGLGLYLLYAQSPQGFSKTTPIPDSLTEWLEKRQAKTEEKAEKADKPIDEAAREKRLDARRKKVDRGIDELQDWIKDIIRAGILTMPQQYQQLIPAMASRLVDAQAPGLAAQVRKLANISFYEEGWQASFLRRLSSIYLLAQAYRKKEVLEPSQQVDTEALIGFSPAKEEVLAGETVADEWLILSKNYTSEENLTTEIVWFWGCKTGRFAYHLQFFAGSQITELLLMPGTVLHGELAFYPGSFPLRALIKSQLQTTTLLPPVNGITSMEAVKERIADISAVNPFLENIPILLQKAGLAMENNQLFITDAQGRGLNLLNKKEALYRLLASTKGNRFDAFCLFTEGSLQVKTIINSQEMIAVA
jgi:hypothetical protein